MLGMDWSGFSKPVLYIRPEYLLKCWPQVPGYSQLPGSRFSVSNTYQCSAGCVASEAVAMKLEGLLVSVSSLGTYTKATLVTLLTPYQGC